MTWKNYVQFAKEFKQQVDDLNLQEEKFKDSPDVLRVLHIRKSQLHNDVHAICRVFKSDSVAFKIERFIDTVYDLEPLPINSGGKAYK